MDSDKLSHVLHSSLGPLTASPAPQLGLHLPPPTSRVSQVTAALEEGQPCEPGPSQALASAARDVQGDVCPPNSQLSCSVRRQLSQPAQHGPGPVAAQLRSGLHHPAGSLKPRCDRAAPSRGVKGDPLLCCQSLRPGEYKGTCLVEQGGIPRPLTCPARLDSTPPSSTLWGWTASQNGPDSVPCAWHLAHPFLTASDRQCRQGGG